MPKSNIFGEKISLFARVFGCWHFILSRPITIEKETYCVCVKCGARIRFDTERLTIVGDYYYPPIASLYPQKSITKKGASDL